MIKPRASFYVMFCCLILTTGCGSKSQAGTKPVPQAAVSGAVKETELATIRLTREAETRLGIEVVPAESRSMATYRTLSGEVTLPLGQSQSITVPVAGTLMAVGQIPQVGESVQRGQPLY